MSLNGQMSAREPSKTFLFGPPILATPTSGEDLYLYLAINGKSISSVLAQAEGRQHLPM